MLTDADLDSMRDTVGDSLGGTAVIQSRTVTSDGGGGGTISWTASGTVSCRIAPMSGDEDVTGERISPESDWVVTLPAETSVSTDSRIVSAGGTFNVVALRFPRTYEIDRRVEVTKQS